MPANSSEIKAVMKRGGWFRLYSEVVDDPKVQLLPDRLFKLWINLLAITAQRRGHLPPARDIAFRLRISLADAEDDLAALISHGLLDWTTVDGKKALQPHNWTTWQPPSSLSTKRVVRHRKNKRNGDETAVKRSCHGRETLDETVETYSRSTSTSTVETYREGNASQEKEVDTLEGYDTREVLS